MTAAGGKPARGRRALALAGVVAAILMAATPAPAEAAQARVVSHYHSGSPTPANISCPPRSGAVAVLGVQGTIAYGQDPADTLEGTAALTSCIYPMPDDTIDYIAVEAFTGSLDGCGSGSVKVAFAGTVSKPDPVTGNRHDHGAWAVIPKTGMGGLAGVKFGTGTVDGTATPSLSADGLLVGAVSC